MVQGQFWIVSYTPDIVLMTKMAKSGVEIWSKYAQNGPILAIFDPKVYQIKIGTWSDMSEVICRWQRSIRIELSANLGNYHGRKALILINIARIGHYEHILSPKRPFFFTMINQKFKMMIENVVNSIWAYSVWFWVNRVRFWVIWYSSDIVLETIIANFGLKICSKMTNFSDIQ